jgi:hypothetical protein
VQFDECVIRDEGVEWLTHTLQPNERFDWKEGKHFFDNIIG